MKKSMPPYPLFHHEPYISFQFISRYLFIYSFSINFQILMYYFLSHPSVPSSFSDSSSDESVSNIFDKGKRPDEMKESNSDRIDTFNYVDSDVENEIINGANVCAQKKIITEYQPTLSGDSKHYLNKFPLISDYYFYYDDVPFFQEIPGITKYLESLIKLLDSQYQCNEDPSSTTNAGIIANYSRFPLFFITS